MSDSKDSSSDHINVASSEASSMPQQSTDKMSAVRNAKKRKAQDRDDVLSDLKKQVGTLADAMTNSKPQVVTRQREEDTAPPQSFSTEILRTAIVGFLGLGTWYVSNIWAKRPKLKAPVHTASTPTPAPAPAPPTPTPPSTAPPAPAPTPKASPTHFIDMKPKRKVGASGLLE